MRSGADDLRNPAGPIPPPERLRSDRGPQESFADKLRARQDGFKEMQTMPLAPGASKLRQEARAKANRQETLHQRLATARAPQYRMATPSPRDHVLPEKIQKRQDERLLSFKKKRYPAVERPELKPTREQRKQAARKKIAGKRESARQIDGKRPREEPGTDFYYRRFMRGRGSQ